MKKNLLMLALMGAVSVGAFASQDTVASAKKVEAPAKASDEHDFVSKLNEGNKKAFSAMTAEQKKAAVAMLHDAAAKVDANQAVEKVLAAKAEKPAAEKQVSQTAPAAAKPAAPQAK